jgi:hypothetical protein
MDSTLIIPIHPHTVDGTPFLSYQCTDSASIPGNLYLDHKRGVAETSIVQPNEGTLSGVDPAETLEDPFHKDFLRF